MEIEASADKLRAHELVEQFKQEMNKTESTETETSSQRKAEKPSADETIEMDEEQSGEQQKTVGKKKERS